MEAVVTLLGHRNTVGGGGQVLMLVIFCLCWFLLFVCSFRDNILPRKIHLIRSDYRALIVILFSNFVCYEPELIMLLKVSNFTPRVTGQRFAVSSEERTSLALL